MSSPLNHSICKYDRKRTIDIRIDSHTYSYDNDATFFHSNIYYSSGGVWGIVRCHDFPHIYFITTRNIFHPKSCKKYLNILIPIS